MFLLKNINIKWLVFKNFTRSYVWSLIKLIIFTLWGLIIINLSLSFFLKINFSFSQLEKFIIFTMLFIINFLLLLFAITIFILTLKQRNIEFGLLRAVGGTRSEIFNLIMNETLFLPSFSTLLCVIIELFFLLKFKFEICGNLKIVYDFTFFKFLFISLLVAFIFKFVIISISLLPIAIYYSRIDPYKILRE